MKSCRWFFDAEAWDPTPERFEELLQTLPFEEQQRIRRFRRGPTLVGHKNPDAKRSLVGQIMLRRHASEMLGLPFANVVLLRTKEGKPYVQPQVSTAGMPYHSNVSHAGDFVVFASELQGIVGVDVMPIELVPSGAVSRASVDEFFRTMVGQFTTTEWARIRGSKDDESVPLCQLTRFYLHWTLKEAYIKAIGIGLGLDLLTIAFEVEGFPLSTMVRFWRDGIEMSTWSFHVSLLGQNHIVAVAKGPPSDATAGFREVCDTSVMAPFVKTSVYLPFENFSL